MKPKLISLGYAVPERSYTQEQVFATLGYPRAFWPVFSRAGVDKRHFWVAPERIWTLSWQEQQEEYSRGALALSQEAIQQCLDGRPAEQIALLAFASCTGFAPGPTIGHYLLRDLGFPRDCYLTNIASQGCEGAFPSLKRAVDFTQATGRRSLAVACELSSTCYYPEPGARYPEARARPDPENHFELARSHAIFADAAVAALVGFDDDPRHPVILDEATYTNPDYLDDLGFQWRDGRLRVKLSRRVPELAPLVVKPAVTAVLERHSLDMKEITWWVIHAAGSNVLDNIRDALGLAEDQMGLSREALKLFGNTSSTSIGIQGKMLMESGAPQVGDYGLVLSVGPGMTGGATLLRWGNFRCNGR